MPRLMDMREDKERLTVKVTHGTSVILSDKYCELNTLPDRYVTVLDWKAAEDKSEINK